MGWATGIPRLIDWAGSGISIKANTSIAAMAAGIALLLAILHPPARRMVAAMGVFVATLGALTLFEHITSWDLGIDTLLFEEEPGAAATASPGRMGPPAATSFLAIGVALVLLNRAARARATSAALGLVVFALGMLSLTGYWYGEELMYASPRITGIAAQTASMLVALGIGVIAASPDRQPMRTLCEDSIAGTLARRLVPLVVAVPLVLGWLRARGEQVGLYDSELGTALRSVLEAAALGAFLWWSLRAIREQELHKRRAERELRESEQRLGHTLESITDGFVTLDSAWRFAYVNREAERILRRPRAELLGKDMWELFPEIVGTELESEFRRAATERVMVEIDSPDQTGGGRSFTNRVYPNIDGGVSVYFQDVTLRKQAEHALKEADRRKDEFIATLAHELRNPLAPIGNAANVLLRKGLPEAMLRWGAEVIDRQVRHMARLLEDLLDVSRLSLNRLELRKEWVELASVIHHALETSGPLIEAAGHELTVDVPPEPIYVDGDSVRLAQVFSNLLNNSAKYTERGGHISLAVHCEASDVVARVKDDGIGIAPEMLPKIFEMFAQSKPAVHRQHGGLGIGLWLAKGVVELHGGRIEAHSPGPGEGTELVVRLPRVTEIEEVMQHQPDDEPILAIIRRVLVVDDVKDAADSLATLLQTFAYHVRTAYSGEEGIEVASSFHPEVIFLDIGMPVLNGFDVCRRIRGTPWGKRTCIVALTGCGQAEDRRRAQESGFDQHLIKPVEMSALVRLLESLSASDARRLVRSE